MYVSEPQACLVPVEPGVQKVPVPGTGIINSCELSLWVLGTEPGFSEGAAGALITEPSVQ